MHLRARTDELEQATTTRVQAISGPGEATDPIYRHGLRVAVAKGIEFAIDAVERDEDRNPIPVALMAQARTAARRSVSQSAVLLRCVAASHILLDALQQASMELDVSNQFQHRLRRNLATALERLLSTVAEEYEREEAEMQTRSEGRTAAQIARLIDGQLVDVSSISYDFDVYHLGILASGADADSAIRRLALAIHGQCLVVRPIKLDAIWAWLGRLQPVASSDLDRVVSDFPPFNGTMAIGEFCQGMSGWRLSHQQARAAFHVALQRPNRLHRYSAVAMLAAVETDDVLRRSLQVIYLEPLTDDGTGSVLRETLRAYFATSRNRASAASSLGVSRQTVANRLQAAEERLGRSLTSCATELEVALSLEHSFPLSH